MLSRVAAMILPTCRKILSVYVVMREIHVFIVKEEKHTHTDEPLLIILSPDSFEHAPNAIRNIPWLTW